MKFQLDKNGLFGGELCPYLFFKKTSGLACPLLIVILMLPWLTVYGQLPIPVARTANFKTNEGSYMDVDVSPDGKTLLFTLLGDIYSMSVEGGKAVRITKGLSLNYQPVWSPNGKFYACVSDQSGNYQLHVRSISGKQDMQITTVPNGISYGGQVIYWRKDGNKISFDKHVYDLTNGKKEADTINNPLLTADLRVSNSTKLTPDKSQLLIQTRHGSWSLNAVHQKSGAKTLLVESLLLGNRDYQPVNPDEHFGISPDSKWVYIGYGGKIHRINILNSENKIIPFEADVRVDLGKLNTHQFKVNQEPFKISYIRSANKRPDGKQIVYSAMNKIYVKDLPGGNSRLLVKQDKNQYQPIYSPDGRWIAYVSWSDQEGGALWRVSADGGTVEKIIGASGQFQRPAWSPDGQSVAVLRDKYGPEHRDYVGAADLLLISINSKEVKLIDRQVPLWNTLVFSKDGSTIDYVGQNYNQLLRRKLSADTTSAVIAYGTAFDSPIFYQQRSISPDQRYFLYALNENIYLVKNDPSQKPMRIFDKDDQAGTIRLGSGVDPHWDADGSRICWNYSNKYYEVSLRDALSKNKIVEITKLTFEVAQAKGEGYLALTNVKLLTMNNSNQVIDEGTILIKDGRISAIGKSGDIKIPAHAEVKNLKGTTVMPGLIDLHDHMYLQEDIFPQQSWIYQANLAYGVTTACDPSASYSSFGYAELLKSGDMLGPRLFTVGRSINPGWNIDLKGKKDALDIALKRREMGGTLIKQYTLPTRMQRQWLIQGADQAGLNMTNEGAHNPTELFGMIKDGSFRIEHNPDWGNVYNDVFRLLAKSGTILTPALQAAYGTRDAGAYFSKNYWNTPDEKLRRFWSSRALKDLNRETDTVGLKSFLTPATLNVKMFRQGAKLGLGSHGEAPGIGAHSEIWALQMAGLTNMEVLSIATIEGANALGVQRDLGSLEAGKIADLIVLYKDPLVNIFNTREIMYVMKDGFLYDGNTLDALWPFNKKCPTTWQQK